MADQNENFEKDKMLTKKEKVDMKYLQINLSDSKSEYGLSGKGKRGTNTCFKIVVACLIAVNVLLMLGLLVVVVKWREDRIKSLAPQEQALCLKCIEIGLDGKHVPEEFKDKIKLEKKNDTKNSVCCGHTSVILDLTVAKAIKDRGTGAKSGLHLFETEECKKNLKVVPSAQMNGISVSHIIEGKTDVIHWNTTGASFKKGGITYNNGRLSTTQSGYYYIFSQVMFRKCFLPYSTDIHPDTISMNDKAPSHLDHFIYHHSSQNDRTKKILESSKSSCEVPFANDETTSSIGAVFYLAVNDEVFVKTSHPDCLSPSHEGNHFGVYLT